jgi:hypothetical protein
MPGIVQPQPTSLLHSAAVALFEQGCTTPPQPPFPSEMQPGQ